MWTSRFRSDDIFTNPDPNLPNISLPPQPSESHLQVIIGSQGSQEELLNAQTRIWSYAFGCTKSMSLMVAVQLGIPDAVHSHGGPIPLSLLASTVSVPESKVAALRRLMRTLAHSGVFHREVKPEVNGAAEEELYSPTIFSQQLRKDNPTAAAPFLLLALYPLYVTMWYEMAAWLREEGPRPACGFEAAHGETMLESFDRVPKFNDVLNSAMACDSRWAVGMVTREHPEVFGGMASLVDVGGGDGTSAKAIKDAFPEMKCTVLELPQIVAASPAIEGVELVAGDMFEQLPLADAVLLKWVLINWNDEDCVRILRRCREAILPAKERGGKVIIVESVMGRSGGSNHQEAVEVQHLLDLHMLATMEGRERDEGDWRRLIAAAGFSVCKITPALGPRSVIEAYP